LFIFALKHTKDFISIIKDNYIFNITKIITIKFINTILENKIFKKIKFNLKKSNLIVKKQKVQQLFIKYVTSN